MIRIYRVDLVVCLAILGSATSFQLKAEEARYKGDPQYQYEFHSIAIPKAEVGEPKLETFSLQLAGNYLDQGATAWNKNAGCISCHTNGAYFTIRPGLTPVLGRPSPEARAFLEETLKAQLEMEPEKLRKGVASAQVIHTAAGLAEWDAHVTKRLSPQTVQALALMFRIQKENGTWTEPNLCWPPFESDSYHETALAAIAVATAPGWNVRAEDKDLADHLRSLKQYLRTQPPPHDYARVWQLRAACAMKDLLTPSQKKVIVNRILELQHPDGGWSIRNFAKPESWGDGRRTAKLKSEPDYENPPSDGHQTGLALVALREAGIAATDPRIQKGVQWLLTNQRVSGRWWTRSLNTDKWHFVTYSGTGYALQALALCNALPR